MRRVTLRVPEQQLEMLDALVKLWEFPSVSAKKEFLERKNPWECKAPCA